jgi:hypothetical protein
MMLIISYAHREQRDDVVGMDRHGYHHQEETATRNHGARGYKWSWISSSGRNRNKESWHKGIQMVIKILNYLIILLDSEP